MEFVYESEADTINTSVEFIGRIGLSEHMYGVENSIADIGIIDTDRVPSLQSVNIGVTSLHCRG